MNQLIHHLNVAVRHSLGILIAIAFFPAVSISQDPLPRRISLGVQVKPVSTETQQRLKLRNSRGVEVVSIVPDSTAAAVGVMRAMSFWLCATNQFKMLPVLWNKSPVCELGLSCH